MRILYEGKEKRKKDERNIKVVFLSMLKGILNEFVRPGELIGVRRRLSYPPLRYHQLLKSRNRISKLLLKVSEEEKKNSLETKGVI